jgi:hypothetical protein
MRWQLEFPRFFVAIPDVPTHLRQEGVPVCRMPIQVLGSWADPQPESSGNELISITARYGTTWDGFYLGYELTAKAPSALYGRTRLAIADLQDLRLQYADDQLEAEARRAIPVETLIEEVLRPENRVPAEYGCNIPGGECLEFSTPLRALMFRGAEARGPLLARLDDPEVRNEVVLALGAVGDERTVPELIARYPRCPIAPQDSASRLAQVCFSFALCWLTGEPIDRSRYGTAECEGCAEKWEAWWSANRDTFRVPAVKPYATWVPSYPVLSDEHIARIRSMFAERYQGFECE